MHHNLKQSTFDETETKMNQKQIYEHLQQTCYIHVVHWKTCTITLVDSNEKTICKLTDKQHTFIKSNYTLKSIDSESYSPIIKYQIVPK